MRQSALRVSVISSEQEVLAQPIRSFSAAITREPRALSICVTSLFYDPALLTADGSMPAVTEFRQGMDANLLRSSDLIIVPEALKPEQEAVILDLVAGGKKVFWVRPSADALQRASGGRIRLAATQFSHGERWTLGKHHFSHPRSCSLDLYDATPDVERAWPVGDWPALYRVGGHVFAAASLFNACSHTWNTPRDVLDESGFGNNFYAMVVAEVSAMLGRPVAQETARSRYFLRRDFHAYGFTRLMVAELAALQQKAIDFSVADACLVQAAQSFQQGATDAEVEARLKAAFEALYECRRGMIDIPVYYADAMHGGILTPHYGYIEFASPEFVQDLLRMFFAFARRRGYRFSMDVSIMSWQNLAQRCPALHAEMKEAQEAGWFEIANGSMGQPFPHYFGLESNIRQFSNAQVVLEQLFGRRADSFLAQEMQLAPVYPSILEQTGFKLALHRVQNSGQTVYDDDLCINWQGPDGDMIKTIPNHYGDSQQAIATGFVHWPQLITTTAQHYPAGIFTNLLDLTWITLFRDEAIRSSYYAPVLGKFVTYRDLEPQLTPQRAVVYGRNDYRPQLFTPVSWTASDMNALGRRLEACEMFAALSGNDQLNDQIFEAWSLLTAYQNHDNTACIHVPPTGRYGPYLLDTMREDALRALEACESKLGKPMALFNSLTKERAVDIYCKADSMGTLKNVPRLDELDGLARVTLSALGQAGFPEKSGQAQAGGDLIMDNGRLRVRMNAETGALSSIYDQHAARELLAGAGNQITPGMDGGYTKALHCEKLTRAGVEQLYARMEMYFADGRFAGWVETTATLPLGEARIYFRAKTETHGIVPRNYLYYYGEREKSIGVAFDLIPGFEAVRDCWLHRVHEPLDETLQDYCPGLFFGSREHERIFLEATTALQINAFMGIVKEGSAGRLVFHNDGAQVYEVHPNRVTNLLCASNEYVDTFAYALELVPADANPFDAFLDYQYEPLPMPRVELVPRLRVGAGLWISSIRRKGTDVYVRIAETCGRAQAQAVLEVPSAVVSAARVNLLDEEQKLLSVADGRVVFPIGASGIVTIRLSCRP